MFGLFIIESKPGNWLKQWPNIVLDEKLQITSFGYDLTARKCKTALAKNIL